MLTEITNENFNAEVMDADVPVLLDFWAPWCGPCKMIGPVLEDVAGEIRGRAKICKINVDEQMELAQEYGVSTIPTLVLFIGGAEADRMVGYQSKEQILEVLDV